MSTSVCASARPCARAASILIAFVRADAFACAVPARRLVSAPCSGYSGDRQEDCRHDLRAIGHRSSPRSSQGSVAVSSRTRDAGFACRRSAGAPPGSASALGSEQRGLAHAPAGPLQLQELSGECLCALPLGLVQLPELSGECLRALPLCLVGRPEQPTALSSSAGLSRSASALIRSASELIRSDSALIRSASGWS